MIALTGEELREIIGWLLGDVSMRGWSHVYMILHLLSLVHFMLWSYRRN